MKRTEIEILDCVNLDYCPIVYRNAAGRKGIEAYLTFLKGGRIDPDKEFSPLTELHDLFHVAGSSSPIAGPGNTSEEVLPFDIIGEQVLLSLIEGPSSG
jgi:hypothetical protein